MPAPVQTPQSIGFDNVTSQALAFASNVTSGSTVIVAAFKAQGTGVDAFVAGDLTKASGTATIGTVTMDVQRSYHPSGLFADVAVFSVPITGAGSLTLTLGGMSAGSFGGVGWIEGPGSLSAVVNSIKQADAGASANQFPDTGDGTTTTDALFVGVFTDSLSSNDTITPDAGDAFTQLFEQEDGTAHQRGGILYKNVTGGVTLGATWDCNSTVFWVAAQAAYSAAGGGGISEVQVDRGRTFGRGLMRGM